MRAFEVGTDALHAGGNRLHLIRDDLSAVTVGPTRSSRYGHDGLKAAAALFADRWGYAIEVVGGDLETAGAELHATARDYDDRDHEVAGGMEPR